MLLLTVTDVSTTRAVVIFRVKVNCITAVDGIILWLLIIIIVIGFNITLLLYYYLLLLLVLITTV